MSRVRGLRKAFKCLEDNQDLPIIKPVKGRSKELIEKRNALLVHRYFFYRKFTSDRYEVIIKRLKNEFFIAEFTIGEILSLDTTVSELKSMSVDKHNPKTFKRNFPHLDWKPK